MAQQNYYKANLRDLSFLLFEQFKLDELLGKEPFANWGKDEVLAVLEEAYGWAQKYLGPLNGVGDERAGARSRSKRSMAAKQVRSRSRCWSRSSCAARTRHSTCTRRSRRVQRT
jgi:hypothetical protein